MFCGVHRKECGRTRAPLYNAKRDSRESTGGPTTNALVEMSIAKAVAEERERCARLRAALVEIARDHWTDDKGRK